MFRNLDLARTGNAISGSPQTTWIGLVRADYLCSNWTAKWIWMDGTEVDYLAWDIGQPGWDINKPSQQNCVEVPFPYIKRFDNKQCF
ncbi:unnamed protein product [Cylicostephanus goldi]|uniref:C-type lectin domain-containing protein n=1 Tax=Cylicostephanus goldi TaxID=71465 RepID=A0A3P7PSN9_CYLGO|nr:unnamed protein product [Cylicostephanus goldi]